MTEPVDVKVAKSTPSGATAVAVTAHSDRLNRVPGLRKAALERAGFSGAVGTTATFDDGERATVVVGLGPSTTSGSARTDALRRGAAAFARAVGRHRRVAFEVPDPSAVDDLAAVARALTEGLVLGSYRFDDLRSAANVKPGLATATLVVGDDNAAVRSARDGVRAGAAVADAVCFARDLVNTPGGTLTAPELADRAAVRATAAGIG
ncbi:MAG TPA: M17 family peptidase N-terminal domain-containing protein, partial [Microthrixaceae bacterium]|nr:M17 family peptidase N-terminal domain-containing protein [Microthrixaceae bacterium]